MQSVTCWFAALMVSVGVHTDIVVRVYLLTFLLTCYTCWFTCSCVVYFIESNTQHLKYSSQALSAFVQPLLSRFYLFSSTVTRLLTP